MRSSAPDGRAGGRPPKRPATPFAADRHRREPGAYRLAGGGDNIIFTACYDPWYRQKMNISRGGLFAYVDWFFRDAYGLKFFIPLEFSLAPQDFGLLRFNDEK